MESKLIKVFERLSGWKTPDTFGHENDGYITFETDPKTHATEAFLWKSDMSHEHLQSMWLCGQTFVRR